MSDTVTSDQAAWIEWLTNEQFTSRKMNIAGFNAAIDIYRPAANPTTGV